MTYTRKNSCTFTGHRAAKLPWRYNEQDPACLKLKQAIADTVSALYGDGIRHFICGMANGCDMYFAEAVLALRTYREDITLEAAIPHKEQTRGWSADLIARYNRILAEADCYTVVSQNYTSDCMQKRNEYMVDNASVLIAAYNGTPGGTRNTMLYAMRAGVRIVELVI